MESAATPVGPWLVLGVVLGVLLAAVAVLGVLGLRPGRRAAPDAAATADAAGAELRSTATGWSVDDLPGFLAHPPGLGPEPGPGAAVPAREVRLGPGPALLDVPVRRPGAAAPAPDAGGAEAAGRLLVALAAAAVVLVGAAAALAAVGSPSPRTSSATSAEAPGPTWLAPDVSGVPARPAPGDPGAGLLAAASVPVGPDGALARATFAGLVLERRAVGVTVAYPAVSVTSSDTDAGPALAHVRLPVWNCLRDTPPADPVAAGCRRLPTQHAELGTPALSVTEDDGSGLRISGRFPTYLRPAGSPPTWTGHVYPLTVAWTTQGGTVHLGTERAPAVDDPRLTDLRFGR